MSHGTAAFAMNLTLEEARTQKAEAAKLEERRDELQSRLSQREEACVCYFLVLMGLFLLNLPYTHREIDCYFLVFMGLFALNIPCTHREIRD
eukprot:SAG31_NODE_1670_length_7567_cov_13.084360_9_plen_92_part_00